MNTPEFPEPIFDVAEMASFELYSPCVDETVWFFRDLLGMVETGRDGRSVYMRGYEDPYKHSLKITERDQPGMGFAGWRASSQPALERRVSAIEASGLGRGWVEGEVGMGPAYEFTTPDGAGQRINFEVDYFQAAEDQKSVVLNRPQRRPLNGVPVRGLDHLNILSKDVTANKNFYSEVLGFKLSEHIVLEDGEAGAWLRAWTRTHDVALVKDAVGGGGRLHHVAFLYGVQQHLEDACDVMTDAGIEFEAGPAWHAISRSKFVYVFEPGGNRIELVGQLGPEITDPTYEPVLWGLDSLDHAIIWYGADLPAEFDTYGTPVAGPTAYRTPNRYIADEAKVLFGAR
ncbi:VOC family protein [Rothia uropygialis]|uniref:VOC family protein n=1 Tax=Kocuria sp. 36 TaxID=1415402 RepID=UPI0019310456|nr:VOC family protein [Kocuria sp. 36]